MDNMQAGEVTMASSFFLMLVRACTYQLVTFVVALWVSLQESSTLPKLKVLKDMVYVKLLFEFNVVQPHDCGLLQVVAACAQEHAEQVVVCMQGGERRVPISSEGGALAVVQRGPKLRKKSFASSVCIYQK